MSLTSIIDVAKAVEAISTEKNPVRFEIYTGQNYIDKFANEFTQYTSTKINRQHDNYQVYLALLESSDLNVLCYNFDEKSKVYLKYSMANKLPETIGANVPFLAIGSKEIGTITYLLEERYPFVVAEHNQDTVQSQIKNILFNEESVSDDYFDALNSLKEEFSAARNQHGFQNTLRQISNRQPAQYSADDRDCIDKLATQLFELLGERKGKYQSLKLLPVMLGYSAQQCAQLASLMQSHGVEWQFKQLQPKIEKLVRQERHSDTDNVEMMAFLITSLEHERFESTNAKVMTIFKKNQLHN